MVVFLIPNMRSFKGLGTWLVTAFGIFHVALGNTLAARDDATFDWLSLTPSTNLSWVPCYIELQCARLTVPLQYSDPSAGQAQVALVMAPSNLSHDDPAYLGPWLFNPGGPGGSGVESVIQDAASFRSVLGPQYDIVGFDPRGVGHTTPLVPIFQSPPEALEFLGAYPTNANESISSFGRQYAQGQILGQLAVARAKKLAESVSTPTVATDMLSITRAFGEDKLAYYGVSYGSALGETFAAMYPNNVGRIVIDGIVNGYDYYQGTFFEKDSLLDTDAVLTSVYEACVAAGPSACPIFENTTEQVRDRVNKLIENTHLAPVPVIDPSEESLGAAFAVVDYSIVVQSLLTSLYDPYADAAQFAEAVVQLEKGNGTLMFQGSIAQTLADPLATCNFNASQAFSAGWIDIQASIGCGDILTSAKLSREEARAQYEELSKQSAIFGPAWYARTQGICSGWTIRAKDSFNGSFETNTSFPILLIGNSLDPVTPMVNAHIMSAGFKGSVVLQQNSTGHTSLSGQSTCIAMALNAYFNNGTLPAPGTVCQLDSDTKIFGPPGSTGPSFMKKDSEPPGLAESGFTGSARAPATRRSNPGFTKRMLAGRMIRRLA
ncbi:uncharacterized protein PHACADRAFT_212991 [Phanerochaete carnosa HHB-10118-sp]|uniref:Peptidase S33 tripeptidyl aminopeptidase-like C-terminal domain-containing protein n=1 Tax=Phanerochaete carnosa (strain HHB-10118-sp) TaxID=650164 RepID=K5UMZ4_PHACS|nr:uncharacterized protein PHACADRAFT_212991 [Phanerochaete carnosa HHB-10118-sp]EKM51091.1 hypothetical protein PHACADRAFT_212991 [Phanerochaete carnosa HHB-10118-sp]